MEHCVISAKVLPEQRTLRDVLSRKFPNGMPEDSLAIVLKSTIKGLNRIHTLHGGQPEVNAGRVYFLYEIWEHFHLPNCIRLAYHEDHMQMGNDDPERPEVGIWGAGIVALELAYGSLPDNITPQQLVTLANNMVRILKQKLDNQQKKIKKLPNTLQVLLDDGYVNYREQKLMDKKNAKGIIQSSEKTVFENSSSSSPMAETHQKRSFSRDFLEVVMKCLDKGHPTPINQILELPFFQNVNPVG